MLWKKLKHGRTKNNSPVKMGVLERLVDKGVNTLLVWNTYVAATNMPEPEQQHLGLYLIHAYLTRMSELSGAYVTLSRLIGGNVEVGKAISNAIQPLDEVPYAPDVFTEVTLNLLGVNPKFDSEKIPLIEDVYEAMREYNVTERAMFRFVYRLTPQVTGVPITELGPKSIEIPYSLVED